MKRFLIFMVLMGVLWASYPSVHAQTPHNPPTLPIFDPTPYLVEGMTVEGRQAQITFAQRDATTLYYLAPTADEWLTLPLPADFPDFGDIQARTDGTYLIGNLSAYGMSQQQAWVFDPAAVTLTAPAFACQWVQDLAGEGTWRLLETEAGELFFCFTEDGTTSPPLDTSVGTCRYVYDEHFTSPDNRFTVAFCAGGESRTATLWSWDATTQQGHYLGEVPLVDANFSIKYWLDNQTPLITIQSRQLPSGVLIRTDFARELIFNRHDGVWLADTTIPNSLQAITTAKIYPRIDDQGYTWVPAELPAWGVDYDGPDDCHLHQFDFVTRTLNIIPQLLEGVCSVGLTINDGSGDRVVGLSGEGIYRVNEASGTSQLIYAETRPVRVISVSPTGRWVQISVGDFRDLPESYNGWVDTDENSTSTLILDAQTGSVYFTRPYYISDPMVAPMLAPVVHWWDDDHMELLGGTVYENSVCLMDKPAIECRYVPRRYDIDRPQDEAMVVAYAQFLNSPLLLDYASDEATNKYLYALAHPQAGLIPLLNNVTTPPAMGGEFVLQLARLDDSDYTLSVHWSDGERRWAIGTWDLTYTAD